MCVFVDFFQFRHHFVFGKGSESEFLNFSLKKIIMSTLFSANQKKNKKVKILRSQTLKYTGSATMNLRKLELSLDIEKLKY